MNKKEALAAFLEIDEKEIKEGYAENIFETEEAEYIVLTDTEADQSAKEYILDSLWAFNTDFILNHSKIMDDNLSDREEETVKKAFERMQSELCESANAIVKAIISDIDEFIQDAIDSDGRGHFINSYDGEENEHGEYYIYRTN
jgi:hypothetical protein